MQTAIISGPGTTETIKRKAQYGRKDHLVWIDREGVVYGARLAADTMKAALLAVGTQRAGIVIYHGGDRCGSLCWWWLGINIIRQFKAGHR